MHIKRKQGIQKQQRFYGLTSLVAATNPVFDLLITSNDLQILNVLCYQTKARNPGNTEAAKNTLFDIVRGY